MVRAGWGREGGGVGKELEDEKEKLLVRENGSQRVWDGQGRCVTYIV